MCRASIDAVTPNVSCFVHLRAFGAAWYQNDLDLPDPALIDYFVPCVYGDWLSSPAKHNKILLSCPLLSCTFEWTQHDVHSYGTVFELPLSATLVTAELVATSTALTTFSNL